MSARRVALVDLGLGNLRSVERALSQAAALARLDAKVLVTRSGDDVASADHVVVPGQGAFRDGGAAVASPLGQAIVEAIRRGAPYLGICLGLQLLFGSSDEAPGVAGLGVLAGHNARLRAEPGIKVPHMGWNRVSLAAGAPAPLIEAARVSPWFYFVHSFHAEPDDRGVVVAHATHGSNVVTAAVARDNVLAVQFHPEKSHAAGIALLSSFLRG